MHALPEVLQLVGRARGMLAISTHCNDSAFQHCLVAVCESLTLRLRKFLSQSIPALQQTKTITIRGYISSK